MKVDWTPLRKELARWRSENRALQVWWRDDDAVSRTPALERLSDCARSAGLPIYLAIIPARADDTLKQALRDQTELRPVVHGWAHVSHSPDGEKKAEFGHPRETAQRELADGIARLTTLFGDALVPAFVPPWNRFDDGFASLLPDLGYKCLSTYGPRRSTLAAPGLVQINTHIDPVDWRGTRGLIDPDTLVTRITTLLEHRRQGHSDVTEPLGYLTHHLIHDEGVWTFSASLLSELLDGGATPADIATCIAEGS